MDLEGKVLESPNVLTPDICGAKATSTPSLSSSPLPQPQRRQPNEAQATHKANGKQNGPLALLQGIIFKPSLSKRNLSESLSSTSNSIQEPSQQIHLQQAQQLEPQATPELSFRCEHQSTSDCCDIHPVSMPPFTNLSPKILRINSNGYRLRRSSSNELGGLLAGNVTSKTTRILMAIILLLALILIGLIISDQIFLHKISTSVVEQKGKVRGKLQENGNLHVAASHSDIMRSSHRDYHRDDDLDQDEHDHREPHDRDQDDRDSNDYLPSHTSQYEKPRNWNSRDKRPNSNNRDSQNWPPLSARTNQDDSYLGDSFTSQPIPPTPPTPTTGGRSQDHLDNHANIGSNVLVPGGALRPSGKWRDPDSVCMSAGCVRAAAQILNNIDNQTNPCENFYRFSCGRWIDTQVIPDEKTSLSVFSQITADLNIQLRALVSASPQPSDPPIVAQMRNLYTSCMNLSEIESRGDEPLLEVLRDLGGWPVLSTTSLQEAHAHSPQRRSTNAQIKPTPSITTTPAPISTTLKAANNLQPTNGRSARIVRRLKRQARLNDPRITRQAANNSHLPQQQWLDTLIKFRKRGFSHDMIIDLSVVVDIRNNSRYIVDLDQSSLGLPDRSYYFKGINDTTVAAYYKLMCDAAVMLGASAVEAGAQMFEAFQFETQLAKISIGREQRRNVSRMYNKMSALELYQLAPNINWHKYLRNLLEEPDFDLNSEQVVVKVPNFLRQLDALLLKTEPRVITNYMIWRIVRHSMTSLGRKWRELAFGYNSVTTGRQVEEPRWEICLSSLEGTLATALSALYVKNHFNQASKEAAMEMVDYIRSEFLQMLDEVDWMDEETRREAKLKAQAIAPYIGYPDELLDEQLIEDFYQGLSMSRSNYYANLRELRVWSTDYAFSQLRKANKRGDWKKHARAAVVNAYYNSLENSIEFPAGILRGAFFDAERPNYMNFGAIGYVIGHEITHGFDDRGRQYDKDGQDRFWWKPKTDARFRERAQCIIEQYGNYTVKETGLNVNGLNTQGENIADNGGIKESYRAYQRWTKDHGREARLPGLSYSPDQLFWISAANIWCGKFRPEMLKLRVNSGVHSPAEFRIIGPFSNSPHFAKSFNCPLGSPMNPHKKCSVW